MLSPNRHLTGAMRATTRSVRTTMGSCVNVRPALLPMMGTMRPSDGGDDRHDESRRRCAASDRMKDSRGAAHDDGTRARDGPERHREERDTGISGPVGVLGTGRAASESVILFTTGRQDEDFVPSVPIGRIEAVLSQPV